jgi:hypothetical protein
MILIHKLILNTLQQIPEINVNMLLSLKDQKRYHPIHSIPVLVRHVIDPDFVHDCKTN